MKLNTIKERNTFKKLRTKGRVLENKYLIIYVLPAEEEKQLVRAGFAISRKTGKAFQRNRTRRVLKEILRNTTIPFGINIYIIAKKAITGSRFPEIKEELEKSLDHYFLSYGHKQG